MYLQLGTIVFKPLPVTGLGEKYCYDFPEHPVIEGKPLLQYIGDKLTETTLNIRLHFSFCDPPAAFAEIKAAADAHLALRLSAGDGTNYGMRVITELSKTLVQTADNGRPIVIEAQLSLKEWVDTDPFGSRQAAQAKNAPGLQGNGPVGKVTPQAALQTIMIAGQVKAAGAQAKAAAKRTLTLADFMGTYYPGQSLPPIIGEVKGMARQIAERVGPVMGSAQALAGGVQSEAATLQGYAAGIFGLSSNITRITSNLPPPLNVVGKQIAALNRDTSAQATRMITLTSLQGGAIEAGTRAQMITRMLPAPERL